MDKKNINRRDFLKFAGLTTLGAVSACTSSQSLDTTGQPEKPKKRVLRIAHMTDFHVQPEGVASVGMTRALHHAQSQADPPEIILNTGNSIMDALETGGGKAVGND